MTTRGPEDVLRPARPTDSRRSDDQHPQDRHRRGSAHRVVAALGAIGVGSHDIRLLTGRRPHDTSNEPVGTYAASIGLEVPVGSHGTGVVRRDRGAGAFVGDVERQRKGS